MLFYVLLNSDHTLLNSYTLLIISVWFFEHITASFSLRQEDDVSTPPSLRQKPHAKAVPAC